MELVRFATKLAPAQAVVIREESLDEGGIVRLLRIRLLFWILYLQRAIVLLEKTRLNFGSYSTLQPKRKSHKP
jgi:hypothetical protein